MHTRWYLRQKPVGQVRQVVSPTLPFPLSLPSPFPFPLSFRQTSGREGQIQWGGSSPASPLYKYHPVCICICVHVLWGKLIGCMFVFSSGASDIICDAAMKRYRASIVHHLYAYNVAVMDYKLQSRINLFVVTICFGISKSIMIGAVRHWTIVNPVRIRV